MLTSRIVLLLSCGLSLASATAIGKSNVLNSHGLSKEKEEALSLRERDGKLIPFLAYVTFSQTLCKNEAGDASGVCMKRSTCNTMNGVDLGTCAQGFGTCCSIVKKCSVDPQVITTNGTRLQNSADTKSFCRYEIPRQPGVCQIKLDFNKFMISDGTANSTGTCDADTLTISGHTNSFGSLCGDLEGQHMYLEYASDKINLDIYLVMQMSQNWDIQVTMLKCDSPERAPPGCLQYYTGQRGVVKSLNFKNRHQLNSQIYSVCIRTNPGMKKMTWKKCPAPEDIFFINGDDIEFDPPSLGQVSGNDCTKDWVMIYGENKYCGKDFADVTSTSQPMMLQVHFDDTESIPFDVPPTCENFFDCDIGNQGFCLMYSQTP